MKIDQEKANLDPTSVFSTPEDVYNEETLTQEQKISILRRWEYDARELAVAEEENMTGGPPSRLEEVLRVLNRLVEEQDKGPSAPTKQGG